MSSSRAVPTNTQRTGSQVLLETLHEKGVEVCFANPGTTEMWLVAALDAIPGIRPVLGLHETVCAGAADGYARVARKPACTVSDASEGTTTTDALLKIFSPSNFLVCTVWRWFLLTLIAPYSLLLLPSYSSPSNPPTCSPSPFLPILPPSHSSASASAAPSPRRRPGERAGEPSQRAPGELACFEHRW
jgi:hypothetical protein